MLETDLFWVIITIASVIIEWTVLKVILGELSKLSRSKLILNIGLLIAIFIITIMTLNNCNPNIKLFIGIIIAYIFYIFNYEVSLLKCLFVILFYYMILIGFDAIGSSIVVVLNSVEDLNKLLSNNLLRLELIILTKSLLLSLIPIIKALNLKIEIKKKEYIYIIIPIVANISSIIVIFRFIFKENSIDNTESIIILSVSSILLLSNISLVSIIGRIIKDTNLRIENKMIKEKIDTQYKYYLNLKEAHSKTRKLYHDMNNHMICIQNIYGKHDIANQYIKDVNSKLKECNYVFNTNNMILDVILNEKKYICNTNNIEFLVDINFSECDFIDMPDICSIFSNMLDNSIEACNKIDDINIPKIIKCRGTVVNMFFVIKCENTRTNNIIFRKDKIITDKKDSFLHGIGISSIRNSVEKYNGNVEIDLDENKFLMTIYIPLIKNHAQLGT